MHKVNSKIAASQQRESDEMSQEPMWQQTGGTGVKVSQTCEHTHTHTAWLLQTGFDEMKLNL